MDIVVRSILIICLFICDCVRSQEVCGSIGTNNTVGYGADNAQYRTRLYLNTAKPATCNGIVRNLTFCYYVPDSDSSGTYRAEFAIYRKRTTGRKTRYSPARPGKFKNSITVTVEENDNDSSDDQSSSDSEFQCKVFTLDEGVAVNRGDVIGVSLSGDRRLDIVSDTRESEFNADTIHYKDYNGNIQEPREISNRVIHLFAEIIIINNNGPTDPGVVVSDNRRTSSPTSSIEITNSTNLISNGILNTVTFSDRRTSSPTPSIEITKSTNGILNTVTFSDVQMSSNTLAISTTSSSQLTSMIILPTPTGVDGITGQSADSVPTKGDNPASVANMFQSTTATTSPRPPNSQNVDSNGRTVALVLAFVFITTVILLVFFVVFYIRNHKIKRRYRFFPSNQNSLRKVNFDEDSSGTLAKFDNVLYSNYDDAVELPVPVGLLSNAVYSELQADLIDNDGTLHNYSEVESRKRKPIDSVYSELQADLMNSYAASRNYSALESDKSYMYASLDSSENVGYSTPDRDSLLRVFLAPASKESELYAQLKFCGVKNISRDTIETTDFLGSGQFGDVKKGTWRNEKLEVPVALKTLKQGLKEGHKVKFLQEAAVMAQFSHPNVVILYGVVSKGEPMMLVVELVEKGSLINHLILLKENNNKTPLPNLPNMLLNFSQQVALGMRHLSEKGFVHRDLAARNILVSSDNVCKIADFGMSRDLADETYYVSHGGVIPIKWTAPEAIHYKKYSTASDVWSYGCLLYEIWSLGYKPYRHLSNQQVIRHVENGCRLAPPPGCPRKIYELMIFCWNPDVPFRPKFVDISLELISDRKEVLGIPQEALESHKQAGFLGADLEAGEGMYQDLQNRYVIK